MLKNLSRKEEKYSLLILFKSSDHWYNALRNQAVNVLKHERKVKLLVDLERKMASNCFNYELS